MASFFPGNMVFSEGAAAVAGAIQTSYALSTLISYLPSKKKLPSFQDPTVLLAKRSSSPHFTRCASLPLSPSPTPSTSPAFDVANYWASLIDAIDAELDTAIPCRYPYHIYDAMRYVALFPGAKRTPSIICLAAACDLLGAPRAAALPTACALELAHAASLVHDDLPCIDTAPTRRGRPSTTHAAFGEPAALLGGYALLPQGLLHVIKRTPREFVPEAVVLRIVAEITQAVGPLGMVTGQFLDLHEVCIDKHDVPVLTILEKKYGEMAQCSALCGGLIGGADNEVLERLTRYGRAVGVLYELMDDIHMMEDFGGNGSPGKMRNKNASVVAASGIKRALEIAQDFRETATTEVKALAERYGEEKTMHLQSLVQTSVCWRG